MSNVRHIISRRMPDWKCPHCGKVLSACTVAVEKPEDAIPTAQDFTVCMYCATFLRFQDGGFGFATEDDLKQVDAETRAVAEHVCGPLQIRH